MPIADFAKKGRRVYALMRWAHTLNYYYCNHIQIQIHIHIHIQIHNQIQIHNHIHSAKIYFVFALSAKIAFVYKRYANYANADFA